MRSGNNLTGELILRSRRLFHRYHSCWVNSLLYLSSLRHQLVGVGNVIFRFFALARKAQGAVQKLQELMTISRYLFGET